MDTIRQFNVPFVIAINKFITDTDREIEELKKMIEGENIPVAISEVWENGGAGGIELAKKLEEIVEKVIINIIIYIL